jgi:hypothetical protein
LVQRNLRAQPFDERHTLIGVNANLVGNAVTECPNHQIVSPTRILERVRLWVAGQIADAVTRPNWDSLFAVEQRAASRHYDKNFFLKKVAVPSRRLTPWLHGLDYQADRLAPESPTDISHLPLDRSTVIATEWFEIANIELSKRHGSSSSRTMRPVPATRPWIRAPPRFPYSRLDAPPLSYSVLPRRDIAGAVWPPGLRPR